MRRDLVVGRPSKSRGSRAKILAARSATPRARHEASQPGQDRRQAASTGSRRSVAAGFVAKTQSALAREDDLLVSATCQVNVLEETATLDHFADLPANSRLDKEITVCDLLEREIAARIAPRVSN